MGFLGFSLFKKCLC